MSPQTFELATTVRGAEAGDPGAAVVDVDGPEEVELHPASVRAATTTVPTASAAILRRPAATTPP
jgi:hypothetical protein